MGKFAIKRVKTGVKFNLKAGNGEIIAIGGEVYNTMASVKNGIPMEYSYVLREQRATGYWRSGNVWGAGSRACEARTGIYYCTAGTVAVRASQIPYGTKMYIRTPGGGFIYGYAVANDTGTALEEGIIDVDLFYDSYQESVLNSVRWVDIYVLD